MTPISSIMTTELETVEPDDPLRKIYDIFRSRRIRHIPVVEGKSLKGLVSATDFTVYKIIMDSEGPLSEYSDLTAADIMTTRLATLKSSDHILAAIKVFRENLFHAIPVVDDGELKGIISTIDIIKQLEDK